MWRFFFRYAAKYCSDLLAVSRAAQSRRIFGDRAAIRLIRQRAGGRLPRMLLLYLGEGADISMVTAGVPYPIIYSGKKGVRERLTCRWRPTM